MLIGKPTGDHVDKFERCHWHPGPGGVPLLVDCESWFVGEVPAHLAEEAPQDG